MTIGAHIDKFAGKQVVDWELETGIKDSASTIYRLSVDYDSVQSWTDVFASFLADPSASTITGLVVGTWDFESNGAARIVEALVSACERLPLLTAIFFGDITYEENEISWIGQTDVSPIFEAYPALEIFRVRGGNGLRLGIIHHEHLKELAIETGGLDASIVRDALQAHLPALEHLELWLGSENYGATSTVEDLMPLLADQVFPRLRYLGLRDSEIADAIASALAQSPLLERIRILDLSLGILTDEGMAALLANPALRQLEKLDIHHHFCSDEMLKQVKALGIEVDVSEQEVEKEYRSGASYRYVAVGE